jgi:hypothetical protein
LKIRTTYWVIYGGTLDLNCRIGSVLVLFVPKYAKTLLYP